MKRVVARLDLPDITPGTPPTAAPELIWAAPGDLLVDEVYQRDLSDASLKLIRRIVENWDWRRFKPPVTARTADGLEVIDGQHSAIAAATHGGIAQIPVVVVDAVEQVDRAQAFLGHNRDRLGITPAQMYAAALAAGDEDALLIGRVCAAADVTVLRVPAANGAYKPRALIAVAAVRTLVTTLPEPDAVWVLRTLADGGLAPIAAHQIRALTHLISEEDFAEVDRDSLARAVTTAPIKTAEKEAKEHAAVHHVPAWRGLAGVWFKAARKLMGRRGPRVDEPARAAPPPMVAIPSWVPDDLVEQFCNVAASDGEEVAATHVRKAKRSRELVA